MALPTPGDMYSATIFSDHMKKQLSNMISNSAPYPVYPASFKDDTDGKITPEAMIYMRLRFAPGMKIPLDFLRAYVTDEVACVFIMVNNKPVVLEDDPSLFPSDSLITQLRLLIG